MNRKTLKATLKNDIVVAQQLALNWETDILESVIAVERSKKDALSAIKAKMHEKIAVLSLEDINFTIE